jgi:succinate dehydrogenase / fumarate reductase, flavoprotein subunit
LPTWLSRRARDQLELTHQPLPAMRPDLLGLFDMGELNKYMTGEELAGLPASSATAAAEEGH